MKIEVISGSTRAASQSLKVSNVIKDKLQKAGVDAGLIDLHEQNLPMYGMVSSEVWGTISPRLAAAEGYIWVVPEWNGNAGPGIMNLVTYIQKEQTAHKPVLIVSVSSGAGGSYPIAQLKAFAGKNSRVVFIPESLRFRDVEGVFNATEAEVDNKVDYSMHRRTDYALRVFLRYATHLSQLRGEGIIDLDAYPHGN